MVPGKRYYFMFWTYFFYFVTCTHVLIPKSLPVTWLADIFPHTPAPCSVISPCVTSSFSLDYHCLLRESMLSSLFCSLCLPAWFFTLPGCLDCFLLLPLTCIPDNCLWVLSFVLSSAFGSQLCTKVLYSCSVLIRLISFWQ